MKIKLAFLGFRHGHVMGLYKSAIAHPRVEVVAACEEDPSAAAALVGVKLTHRSYEEIYRDVAFDAIAVGDYFGRRGEIIIDALRRGKHVISDKPICTKLAELEQIEALAREKRLGCLLDLRDHGPFLTMRRLIRDGAIGEVHTI